MNPPPSPPAQRTMADYNKPMATSVRSSITVPVNEADPDYEIKIPFLGMISRDVQFDGKSHDKIHALIRRTSLASVRHSRVGTSIRTLYACKNSHSHSEAPPKGGLTASHPVTTLIAMILPKTLWRNTFLRPRPRPTKTIFLGSDKRTQSASMMLGMNSKNSSTIIIVMGFEQR
ncbi:hypothetical protein LINPERPRIM_LOCUS2168 [Linum perenne]